MFGIYGVSAVAPLVPMVSLVFEVSVVSMVSLVFEVPAPKHPPLPNLSSKLLVVSLRLDSAYSLSLDCFHLVSDSLSLVHGLPLACPWLVIIRLWTSLACPAKLVFNMLFGSSEAR